MWQGRWSETHRLAQGKAASCKHTERVQSYRGVDGRTSVLCCNGVDFQGNVLCETLEFQAQI